MTNATHCTFKSQTIANFLLKTHVKHDWMACFNVSFSILSSLFLKWRQWQQIDTQTRTPTTTWQTWCFLMVCIKAQLTMLMIMARTRTMAFLIIAVLKDSRLVWLLDAFTASDDELMEVGGRSWWRPDYRGTLSVFIYRGTVKCKVQICQQFSWTSLVFPTNIRIFL